MTTRDASDLHHLSTPRTARYATLGDPASAEAAWIVLHGYGQLAAYFIRPFRALDDGTRLIAAPEALSRFYLDALTEHNRVGASWMTKADRTREVDDYVRYLYAQLVDDGLPNDAPVHVLGFSQGTATACRWAALGAARVDRLTLWAGGVPPDLDLNAHQSLFEPLDLTLVIGTEDEYISNERVADEEARLDAHGIPHRTIRFDGGHRIDPDVLADLA
ncbi:MAG: esterase [Bacteroidetes bacterium]|jgi:predicted esterase|nr:esterase [Bacteroidota bacterium]